MACHGVAGTHFGPLSVDGPAPPRVSPGGEVGLVALFQIGIFVAANLAVVPFLTKDAKVGGGLGPILTSFPAGWLVLVFGVITICRKRGTPWPTAVGFDAVRPVDALGIAVGAALQVLVGVAYHVARVDSEDLARPARELASRAGAIGSGFVVLAVFVVVGAPLCEELFYRGVVLNALRRVGEDQTSGPSPRTTVLAVLGSAVWFGLIHLQPLQFPALVVVGLVCATARLRTGRLATAIAVHMGFNAVAIVSLGLELSHR